MAANRTIKICTIAGFVLAEIYMLFTVLAPNVPGLPIKSRMIIPASEIPKSDLPAGTPPPTDVKVTRVLVAAIFFGPFGAMAGMGVGLLIQGATQNIRSLAGRKSDSNDPPAA